MPLRIMQPAQPGVSYSGGGGASNDVQAAFNMNDYQDRKHARRMDEEALRLRQEQLAFEKDYSNRKLDLDSKDSDRRYELDQQQAANQKAFWDSQSPMEQAKAREWESEQAEKRQLVQLADSLGVPDPKTATWADIRKREGQLARAKAIYNEEIFETKRRRELSKTPRETMRLGLESGDLDGTGMWDPNAFPDEAYVPENVPTSFLDAISPEGALDQEAVRRMANADSPDPFAGTPYEDQAVNVVSRKFQDGLNLKHVESTWNTLVPYAFKSIEKELDALMQMQGDIRHLDAMRQNHIDNLAKRTMELDLVRDNLNLLTSNLRAHSPAIISKELKVERDSATKRGTEQIASSIFKQLPGGDTKVGKLWQAGPGLLDDPSFKVGGFELPLLKGGTDYAIMNLNSEMERIQREDPKLWKEAGPVLQTMHTRLQSVSQALGPRMESDEYLTELIGSATKVGVYSMGARTLYETGEMGPFPSSIAQQIFQASNAGDPQGLRKLSESVVSEGQSWDPSVEQLVTDNTRDLPVIQEVANTFSGAANQLTPEELARSGFTGQMPDPIIPWLFKIMGTTWGPYGEWLKSPHYARVDQLLDEKSSQIRQQQEAMKQRKAQMDVRNFAPPADQLKKPRPKQKPTGVPAGARDRNSPPLTPGDARR